MKENDIRPKDLYNEFKTLVRKEVAKRFARVKLHNVNCPACEGKSHSQIFNRLGFDYCECKVCQTIFVNPAPEQESVDDYYTESGAVKFFAEKLYEYTKEVRREKIFRPRAELLRNLISEFGLTNSIILDIGGGTGLLADELGRLNLDYRIIEPSKELTKVCRSKEIKTYNMLFEEFEFKKLEDKDIILTSFELIEHLRDPVSFFRHAYKGMKKGNLFLFTTLSSMGFDLRILWDKSDAFLPPLHLVFFNPKSIRILLERIGFKILEISTPGQLDWDIVEGAYKKEKVDIGRFWKLVVNEGGEEEKQILQKWIASSNFSSHMRVVVRKS